MNDPIKLPPMPNVREWPYSHQELRARDIEVARAALEAAAMVLTEHQIPVGNSAAGEMACEWTYDALKECRDTIRALRIDGETE
jgi:hypothetical protein